MKLNHTVIVAALVAASLLSGGVAGQAQTASNPPAMTPPVPGAPAGSVRPRGMNLDFLAKQLALTDEQKTNFEAALNDQRQKNRAIRNDTTLSPVDKRAKYKELRDDLNVKLKDILTPDQYTKWQSMSGRRRPAPMPPAQTVPATNAPAASS